jgi:hypothetical protein
MVEVMATPHAVCEPYDGWCEVPLTAPGGGAEAAEAEAAGGAFQMKVALLGEEARRGQAERHLEMAAPHGIAEALLQGSAVTRFA